MNERKLLNVGVLGAVVAALCCFSPLLVILLGAVGLSAAVGWLDLVLIPAVEIFVAVAIYAFTRMRRRAGGAEESTA